MLYRGQTNSSEPGGYPATPQGVRPPDYLYRETSLGYLPKKRSLVSRIASILDRPYEWVTKEGSRLTSWFLGKERQEEERGHDALGLLLSIGASASAFATGAASAITGLISPRAWKETFTSLEHPKEMLKSLKNPLTWSYLAGSIIVPAKVLRLVELRTAKVMEPDLSVTDRGSLSFYGLKTGESEKWFARISAEGPTYPVKGVSGSDLPPESAFELETPRSKIQIVEARRGRVIRRAFKVVDYSSGKKIVGLEEWRFRGLLRPKYEYKGLIVDPLRAESVVAERTARMRALSLTDLYMLKPPRIFVRPRLWPLRHSRNDCWTRGA